MKKLSILALFCGLFSLAGDPIHNQHGPQTAHFYLTPKPLYGSGDTAAGIRGENTWGGAMDFGYQPAGWKRLSLEINASYAKGDGIPRPGKGKKGALVEEDLTYRGLGGFLAYTHRLSWAALVGKLGYKYEHEKAEIPGEASFTKDDTGLAYALGIEFHLSKRLELVLEGEGTTIDSPFGFGVQLGLKVLF